MLFTPRSKLSGKGGHEVPYFLLWSRNLGSTRERDGTEQTKEAWLCVCAGKTAYSFVWAFLSNLDLQVINISQEDFLPANLKAFICKLSSST